MVDSLSHAIVIRAELALALLLGITTHTSPGLFPSHLSQGPLSFPLPQGLVLC